MGWNQWIRTVEVEPALAAAEAAERERQVEVLLRTGCRVVHLVGSGEELRGALGVLSPLARRYDAVLDVHVLDADTDGLAAAGADSVTVAPGVAIGPLRAAGVQVGIAYDGDPAAIPDGVDLVLCRSDEAGALAPQLAPGVVLQVEGDVTHDTVRALHDGGARLLVAREAIFAREDLPRAYRRLLQALA
mgnify:CR=1 FL=1